MIAWSLRSRRVAHAVGAFGLVVSLLSSTETRAEAKKTEVGFTGATLMLVASDESKIDQLAAAAKADPSLGVVIDVQTEGVTPTSLVALTRHARALKIFQRLVRGGVDPARIELAKVGSGSAPRLTITIKPLAQARSTPRLERDADGSAASGEFVLNFPSSSAEPIGLDDAKLQSFLGTVGQPGRDALTIEGTTDSTGNKGYNEVLSELRALRVFEILVRAGVPPYRIDTKGSTSTVVGRAESEAEKAAARSVTVRWKTDEAVAEVAAKVEEAAPPAAEPPPPPPPAVEPAPAPAPAPVAGPTLDIVPFGGVVVPMGRIKDDAKRAAHLGLGIGKQLTSSDSGEVRLTLFASAKSRMDAKDAGLEGSIELSTYTLRGDYVFGTGAVRPFLGLGAGYYVFDGAITQKSTGRRNASDGGAAGGLFALGLDFAVAPSLLIAPEVSYHRVAGDFSAPLVTAHLSLRWRI